MSTKKLFLLRHAQATSSSSSSDKDRSLTPQGKDDAKALGVEMQKKGFIPDLILCSSALRTKQTLEGLQHSLGVENVEYQDILYNGSTGDYLYQIQQVDDAYNNILFIAHNPSIYELVILLGGMGNDSVMQRLSEGYQPATLSVIDVKAEHWADIQPAENTLLTIKNPMDYNASDRPTRWM
ncbi:MAG: SixA phosphatase family protein [Alphaproteobacteria bacterium]